jgi:phosphoribosylglycinamide formyltransferase-1
MKVAILISGRGSNMVALVDAVQGGRVPSAEIAVVISDKPDAAGLERARERGVEAVVIERAGRKRAEHDAQIIDALRQRGVELVCLAGYMRLLSPEFVAAFPGKILNIHPSLLPAFPGLNVQRQALEHGVRFAGCTVHFVDESLDGGPIIAQAVVPVLDDDTEATLSARILEEEHRLYPEALALVSSGALMIEGRRVIHRLPGTAAAK